MFNDFDLVQRVAVRAVFICFTGRNANVLVGGSEEDPAEGVRTVLLRVSRFAKNHATADPMLFVWHLVEKV